jgi:hypothetical protein
VVADEPRSQRRFGSQGVDQLEAGLGAVRHPDRHGPVQLDDGGRAELGQRVVERGDARPVGLLGGARAGVAGGDGGLQRVRAERPAEPLRPVERGARGR